MAVVEVIYLVAAALWIFVVLAVAGVGCHYLVKFRKQRRRMNRFFACVRQPVQVGLQGVLLLRHWDRVGRKLIADAGRKIYASPTA